VGLRLLTSIVDAFLDELEVYWPLSTRALRALRQHNEYLEDQGYADIILENLDEALKQEQDEDAGDGIVWDGGDLETD
jgi:hypothetical protein